MTDKKKKNTESNLENLVSESESIYQTQETEELEMPQEWVDEIEERSRQFRDGEDKGYTLEEIMKKAYAHLATIQKKSS